MLVSSGRIALAVRESYSNSTAGRRTSPSTTTKNTTASLIITSMALERALSRMPITKTVVTKIMISTEGKLNHGVPA